MYCDLCENCISPSLTKKQNLLVCEDCKTVCIHMRIKNEEIFPQFSAYMNKIINLRKQLTIDLHDLDQRFLTEPTSLSKDERMLHEFLSEFRKFECNQPLYLNPKYPCRDIRSTKYLYELLEFQEKYNIEILMKFISKEEEK